MNDRPLRLSSFAWLGLAVKLLVPAVDTGPHGWSLIHPGRPGSAKTHVDREALGPCTVSLFSIVTATLHSAPLTFHHAATACPLSSTDRWATAPCQFIDHPIRKAFRAYLVNLPPPLA